MAPRKGAGRKPAKSEIATGLIRALDFIGVLKGPTGQQRMPYMDHVFMANGWAIGFDGVVAAGHLIDDSVNGYVNTRLLSEALGNTSKQFTISVQDNGAFYIESGSYQSLVPSLDPEQAIQTYPDGNAQTAWPIMPLFTDAMVAAGKVVSDTAENTVHASIRLNNGTVMATDGETIVEAWHGSNMPTGVLLPKVFATALAKAVKLGKELQGFGIAQDFTTFTVHFTDKSWLRTNTYKGDWPEGMLAFFPQIFNGMDFHDAPKGFFDAARAVLPFAAEDGRLIIRPGLIRTHPDKRLGAAKEVEEIAFSIDIHGKTLMAVEDHAEKIAVNASVPALVFVGGNVRGAIGGLQPLPEPEPVPEQGGWGTPEPKPQWETPATEQGGWVDPKQADPSPQTGGWGEPSAIKQVAPPAEAAPASAPRDRQAVDPNAYQGLTGLPAGGLNAMSDDGTDDGVDMPGGWDSQAWLDQNQAEQGE